MKTAAVVGMAGAVLLGALVLTGCRDSDLVVVVDPIAEVRELTAEPAVVSAGGSVTLRWKPDGRRTASVRLTKGDCPGREQASAFEDGCEGEETIVRGLPPSGERTVIVTEATTFWCFPDGVVGAVDAVAGRGVRVEVVP
jgi:hypothetical protein